MVIEKCKASNEVRYIIPKEYGLNLEFFFFPKSWVIFLQLGLLALFFLVTNKMVGGI